MGGVAIKKKKKKNAKHIDYLITVNDSLANILGNYFKLKTPPVVIRNIPETQNFTTSSNIIRQKFNIDNKTKTLLFVGMSFFLRTLNLELVIKEFRNKENTALVFIGGEGGDTNEIKKIIDNEGIKNIYFHKTIKPTDIVEYVSSCDIGLVPTWNKKDLSYWYALDNKLFDYINGEIPVLATQQPEYKNIVEKYQIGICVNPDTKNAYFKGFNQILNNYDFYKQNVINAKKILNWNNEKKKLLDLYYFINKIYRD